MQVIDARQAFYQWNENRLNQLLSAYPESQQTAVQLIPLLFQTNHRLLPGYNGPDTPAGIHGYKPSSTVLHQARQMNARFQYQQDTVLKNTVIDAVYLQHNFVDNELVLWVIHIPNLQPDEIEDLEGKLERVSLWLNSRDIRCVARMTSARQMKQDGPTGKDAEQSVAPVFSRENFYVQSCLLAGKYPVWWLIPPEREHEYENQLENIRSKLYVNANEYLDIGGIADFNQNDLMQLAVKQVQSLYRAPEKSWLWLLLLAVKQSAWPQIDGTAWRLKSRLYAGMSDDQLEPKAVFASVAHDYIERSQDQVHILSPTRLFDYLARVCQDDCRQVFSHLGQHAGSSVPAHQRIDIDTYGFINLYRALFQEIRQVFGHLVTLYNYHTQLDEENDQLNLLMHNMLEYLADSDDRISICNTRNRPEFLLGRILLRQDIEQPDEQQWQLVVEMEDGRERVMGGFGHLLSLVAWAWLNRIIDQATQISIECPSRMIRQIDARHVLEVLIQQLNVDDFSVIDEMAFQQPAMPLQSLLFTNLSAAEHYRRRMETENLADPLLYEATDELTVNCEQLVIDSWGEVRTRHYEGNRGVLQCLCDWIQATTRDGVLQPRPVRCFGYSPGISTFWAQRIEQVYDELVNFFSTRKDYDSRFVVRMGPEYFVLSFVDEILTPHRIGTVGSLMNELERPTREFTFRGLERYALMETPLRSIFSMNRPGVVQVFYQVLGRRCFTWVLDEKGSLWRQQQTWYERGSYVAHWLYLMRNIRARLKRINYQNRELPAMEIRYITSNALGELSFHSIGAEAVSAEKGFIDVQVSVVGEENGDRISLTCDGRAFSYEQYRQRVLDACVRYISDRIAREGPRPVYITDIDVPLRLYGVQERDDIQVVHFLKYIRNIENRLNALIKAP